jgi:hypothetical protein
MKDDVEDGSKNNDEYTNKEDGKLIKYIVSDNYLIIVHVTCMT